MRKMARWGLCVIGLLLGVVLQAQSPIQEVCPSSGIRARGANFEPAGIILTYFDGGALWVYDVARATRYPLPETAPCVGNCRLSPDFTWITYLNPQTMVYTKMRLNGTERTPLLSGASDVVWWSQDTFLVWTPDHRAYLQREGDFDRQELPVRGVISVQPRGLWALWLGNSGQGFSRYLINLATYAEGGVTTPILLAQDKVYYSDYAWSPDGAQLAYVAPTVQSENGAWRSELFLVAPAENAQPRQMTDLATAYGAVRINGASPSNLAWSPDGTKIAFWVTPLTGANPETNTGNAVIHLLDVGTGETRRYCGFATGEHTPNPPRLVWSSDSSTLAFGGNVEGDNKGYLLLAMDVASGQLTELSDGIFPALGAPDVLAWGNLP